MVDRQWRWLLHGRHESKATYRRWRFSDRFLRSPGFCRNSEASLPVPRDTGLSWVNMVEICRCPKQSYRVASIICGVIPRREAVSRSICSRLAGRCFADRWPRRSAAAAACNLATNLGDPIGQLGGVGVFQRVLILGAADAVFHGQVLHRLHVTKRCPPGWPVAVQSAHHFFGVICRSSSGLRLI